MDPSSQRLTLVLDTSSPQAQVGICQQGSWLHLESSAQSTLEELHPQIERCLQKSQLKLSDIGQMIFAAGPGSVLGIRVVNALLSTLQITSPNQSQYFAYNSLVLQAQLWQQKNPPTNTDTFLFTEYKNRQFIGLAIKQGRIGPMQEMSTAALTAQTGSLVFYPQRGRTPLPQHPQLTHIDYQITDLPQLLPTIDLIAVKQFPFMLTPEDSTYQKWHGERHRAPLA